jgi:hypothetical protein
MIDDNLYKETFNTAINELSDLMEQREKLDDLREELSERITKVRRGVLALSPLVGEEPKSVENKYPHLFPDLIPSDIGLTDAVRKVLQSAGNHLTAVGVRTELKATGYDTDRYKNVLASIHTVLKRLVEGGEATTGSINDVTAYRWANKKTGNTFDPPPVPEIRAVNPKKPTIGSPSYVPPKGWISSIKAPIITPPKKEKE